jgi:hypothetical protein
MWLFSHTAFFASKIINIRVLTCAAVKLMLSNDDEKPASLAGFVAAIQLATDCVLKSKKQPTLAATVTAMEDRRPIFVLFGDSLTQVGITITAYFLNNSAHFCICFHLDHTKDSYPVDHLSCSDL